MGRPSSGDVTVDVLGQNAETSFADVPWNEFLADFDAHLPQRGAPRAIVVQFMPTAKGDDLTADYLLSTWFEALRPESLSKKGEVYHCVGVLSSRSGTEH